MKLLTWPVRTLYVVIRSASKAVDLLENVPNTVSFVPAKSMVLTPRVCCWIGAATALVDRDTTGLQEGAETKLRFATAGAAIFCFEARRAVLAKDLEAMFTLITSQTFQSRSLV